MKSTRGVFPTAALWAAFQVSLLAATPPQLPADIDPGIKLLQPGVRLTLLAKHPDLVTPTGIDVDENGQIWVVASHTHFRPDPYPGPAHDEILIFDREGKNRRVFYNKTEATMDLELGRDGWVYLAERDRILRIKDTDGDGTADVEENIATLETEETYPHNGLAGLAWHPDGDLVFSMGENFWKEWTLTGTDRKQVKGTGEGGIFRCTSDGKSLRRIARGFWNPFGVCVRRDGAMFVAENDPGARPPCRLLHVVEGGDYGYQRRYGRAPVHPFVGWNGELRGTLPMLAATGEAPCGILPLGGGLLVPSWSDNRIDFFPLKSKGASYETKRVQLLGGTDYFRPTCIAQGPDGAFYLTDWVYTAYEVHQRGRLWKLEIDPAQAKWMEPRKPVPANANHALAAKLRAGDKSVPEQGLLEIAGGSDPFMRQAALQELARRAADWKQQSVGGWTARNRVIALLARRRAKPKDEGWARFALEDDDPEVRFEALRWIADEDLVAFAPDVEKLLRKPDLSFRLFEACLAAANTLAGNSRAGIAEEKMLLARVQDETSPAAIRAHALRLLNPEHRGMSLGKLRKLIALGDVNLTFEAVRTLVARAADPEVKSALLELARDKRLPVRTRAEAVLGVTIDKYPEEAEAVERLLALTNDQEQAVREEAMRSLRFPLKEPGTTLLKGIAEKHPESADLLEYLNPVQLPAPTRSAAWEARIDAVGGKPDLEAGRRLFFRKNLTTCISCHRHSGRGAVVGPDLTAVGARKDRAWLLESILQPGKEVPPQFHPWSLTLKDGSTFLGYLLRKGGRSGKEFYREITGKERAILKSEIVGREQLEISLMPPGLVSRLTARELRDLIAFLMEPSD
ncbi:MAG: PVC-type heme-binding CxxCH protein [Roseibacillus sp.]